MSRSLFRHIRIAADELRLLASVFLLAGAVFVWWSSHQTSQVELPVSHHNVAVTENLSAEILTLIDAPDRDDSPVFLMAITAAVCPPALVEMEEYASIIRRTAPSALIVPMIVDADSVAAARLIAMGNWHQQPIYVGLHAGISTLLSKNPMQSNQVLVLDSSMKRHLASVPMPNNSVTPLDMKLRVIHQIIN